MLFSSSLTTAQVLAVFSEEIAARRGSITDTFHDGRRLFTRSILPHVEEVRPGDRVRGGVALKATAQEIWLYPYLFRLVCRNGAIIAETLEARSLGDLPDQEADTTLQSIREGIEACCAPQVFMGTMGKMRTACEAEADLALALLPLLSGHSVWASAEVVSQIMDRFFREGDQSQFGLANAVTSVARDTQDPELRWNLEEFGGGVAMGTIPRDPADGEAAAIGRLDRAVSIA
jgi:hypothetical protein